jgi:hypothetical protein
MAINFDKYLHSHNGKIIISILLGFGFASLFRKICKGYNCINFYAPKLDEFNDKIFKTNNGCVKYKSYITKCDNKNKIIDFE